MDSRKYLRLWLLALERYEIPLRASVARERNLYIKDAAADYTKGGHVSNHIKISHQQRLSQILAAHYPPVLTYFGAMATKQFKRNRGLILTKARHTFMSNMQDWVRTRALDSATTISDTDSDDVRNAIENGITEGIGVEEIAGDISDVTGLTSFRAATVARTETHAAATYGAISEARQTSDELGMTLMKQWLPTLDDRTRPAHAAMDGSDPIAMEDKFLVDGEELDYPGDPAASPENQINCRCALSLSEASSDNS